MSDLTDPPLTIPAGTQVVARVAARDEATIGGYQFYGSPWQPRFFDWAFYDALPYQWTQACVAAGLTDDAGKPRYTLHQLRHTRATKPVEQGQRLEVVQRVLGHRDPRSTQGYAELAEAQVRAALEAP